MKAVAYKQYGGADRLQQIDLPLPVLSSAKAVIRVHSISLNPRDIRIRQGTFKLLSGAGFSKLTGADFSGTIEEIGANTAGFAKGDAVFGYIEDLQHAASAEYIAVPVKYLARKPEGISFEQAAALGCTYLTALQALRNKARVQHGQRVLLYGAAGGVGTAAIQLANFYGAHVTAVSHSNQGDYCFRQGADAFVAYDQEDVFTREKTFDVFFQVYSAKGCFYSKARSTLKENGCFICLIPNPLYLFKKLFGKPAFHFLLVKNTR